MTKIFVPLLLALIVAGCGTTGGPLATVEDRTGGKPDAGSAQAAGAGSRTGAEATETTGLAATGVAASSLDGRQLDGGSFAGDQRKNPASPLSKRSIYFDYDSFVVKDEYRGMLEAHAGYLLANKGARAILQGNTDERGSREYNLALGQKRAEAVRKALGLLGVSDVQIEAVSFGEEKPRNEGNDEAAYAENRRVDLVYADE
ncbi:MAG: peptidoglycan-associated lipoprotein Pal [Thiobacillus sp.]